jgi:hypothetical protein
MNDYTGMLLHKARMRELRREAGAGRPRLEPRPVRRGSPASGLNRRTLGILAGAMVVVLGVLGLAVR